MKKMTYTEFCESMWDFNQKNGISSKGSGVTQHGIIVFKKENWEHEYSERERSYQTSNHNKAFLPGMSSNSIFASCLDGTDKSLRISDLISDGSWAVDYCYLINEPILK